MFEDWKVNTGAEEMTQQLKSTCFSCGVPDSAPTWYNSQQPVTLS